MAFGLQAWKGVAPLKGVELLNGYGESFNARLRDECLNMEEFWSLPHARALIEAWRIEYMRIASLSSPSSSLRET